MDDSPNKSPVDKVGRNLIKALTFAGAILGAGALGLVKAVVLLGGQAGWISQPPKLVAGPIWILGGAGAGFAIGWLVVRLRRQRQR